MVCAIFLGKQGKRVYTIGAERRVYTIEPQTRKKKKKEGLHGGGVYFLDASFLLTVEVFSLTVRLFYLRWGNRKQKRPNPISGRGEP